MDIYVIYASNASRRIKPATNESRTYEERVRSRLLIDISVGGWRCFANRSLII